MITNIPCCDLCDPTLLDRTQPGTVKATSKNISVKKGFHNKQVHGKLRGWREEIFARNYANSQLTPSAMLDDDTIVVLSSTGPLQRDQVKMLLKSWWIWWDEYGQELVQFFDSLVPLFEGGLAMRPGVQTGVHGVSGELQFKKMEAPSIPIEDTFAEFKGPVVFVCCYSAVSKNGWEVTVED
ncbi:hypothetical protein PHLCEN_2v3923 [Hermanssonia centrifuga]|uniref:Uncharacterized protein n=1 Tax=Hermanssonia centrifuga TaxID=98765 RepID=A0A2R6QB71_9APHY|nr:hypothetical protein PHLCEN_2v3923 [Hermanssonia centrifuga]